MYECAYLEECTALHTGPVQYDAQIINSLEGVYFQRYTSAVAEAQHTCTVNVTAQT